MPVTTLQKFKRGEAQLTAVTYYRSEWQRELRVRLRALPENRTHEQTATVVLRSPVERDHFCDQLEAFLDDPSRDALVDTLNAAHWAPFGEEALRGLAMTLRYCA